MKGLHVVIGGLTTLALMFTGVSGVLAQNSVDSRCTNPDEISCVDWEAGLAIAAGTGAPMTNPPNRAVANQSAVRAAKQDAFRNLLELIEGINVTSSTTMRDAMIESDTVKSQVEGSLRGVRQIGRTRYFDDGSVQVTMEARLREIVPDSLIIAEGSGPPREITPPGSVPSSGTRLHPGTVYTGLVIDARGTGVTPAMAPKVLDPEGREVYGSAYVSREFVLSQGMAGYVKSMTDATGNERVQGNPAVIKAVSASGLNKADVVISQEDADTLRAISQTQTFLRESRVMIVLD